MRAAERGEKIVKSLLIRDIHGRELKSGLDFFFVKKIVNANGGIKQIAWSNAWWIVIWIVGARSRDHQTGSTVMGTGAGTDRIHNGCDLIPAIKADRGLLVGIKG